MDLTRLRSEGVSLECIIHMVSIGARMVRDRLLVIISEVDTLEECQQTFGILELLYSQTSISIGKVSHYSLDFSVCFNRSNVDDAFVELIPQSRDVNKEAATRQVAVPGSLAVPLLLYQPTSEAFVCFDRVLFAGTFDHLHSGHKYVLTRALLMAKEELIVGFACDDLLNNKKCFDCLEPLDTRKRRVSEFLYAIVPICRGCVNISFVETSDAVGPAGTLNFDALVVTPESASGGNAVNERRKANGLDPVEIVICHLLGNRSIQSKLSSTSIRQKICESLTHADSDLRRLRQHWFSLGLILAVDPTLTSVWWSRIRDLYGLKPWKHYHTLQHILEMIDICTSEYDVVPPELMLAVWFHDAIYDPKSESNEADSITLFNEYICDVGELHGDIDVSGIRLAIQLTKDHKSALRKNSVLPDWIRKFLEIDLSILGVNEDRYIQYAGQIRNEYAHLSVEEFKAGRSQFLRAYEEFDFQHLRNSSSLNENKRINIKGELERLK